MLGTRAIHRHSVRASGSNRFGRPVNATSVVPPVRNGAVSGVRDKHVAGSIPRRVFNLTFREEELQMQLRPIVVALIPIRMCDRTTGPMDDAFLREGLTEEYIQRFELSSLIMERYRGARSLAAVGRGPDWTGEDLCRLQALRGG